MRAGGGVSEMGERVREGEIEEREGQHKRTEGGEERCGFSDP